jgi:hypothetical protein
MAELVSNAENKGRQYGVIIRQRRDNKLLALGERLLSIIRTKSLSEPDFPEAQGWHAQDESTKRMWATNSQARLDSHTPSFNIFR